MSVLFEPFRIGSLEVMNRFVRSATFEGRGDGRGGVTDKAIAYYRTLGRGAIGTIISGFMYVRQDGKGGSSALGIDRDDLIPGFRDLANVIKVDGSRAVFQLHHAGGQALKRTTGSSPRSPSADPATVPACISCNRCLAACYHDLPIRCYVNGLPKKGERG